eukprot:13043-Chlamydomonas_euryale.AAC.1
MDAARRPAKPSGPQAAGGLGEAGVADARPHALGAVGSAAAARQDCAGPHGNRQEGETVEGGGQAGREGRTPCPPRRQVDCLPVTLAGSAADACCDEGRAGGEQGRGMVGGEQ